MTDQTIATATVVLGLPIVGGVLTPAAMIALILVSALVSLMLYRARKKGKTSSSGRILVTAKTGEWLNFGLGLGLAVLVNAWLATPWVPKEQLTLSGEDDAIVGYVIGEQAEQVLILDNDRAATWVKREDLEDRRVCGFVDRSWWNETFWELIRGSKYEPCPSDQ